MPKNNIETEFWDMVTWHDAHKAKKSNYLCVQKVLQYLLDKSNTNKVWYWSWELIGKVNSKGDFLSHRSPARLSDLAIYHPELVEDRKIGRFSVYRLKIENMEKIKEFLTLPESK